MKQESPSENLFHYLHWRGDLSFAQAPFCPVDNLIFCCLSYLNWGIPASGSTPETAITLKDAAAYWEHLPESLQQTRVPLDLQLLPVSPSCSAIAWTPSAGRSAFWRP